SANAAEQRTALGEPTGSAADSIVAAATTSTTTTAPGRVPKLPRDQPDDPPQRHTRSDPEPHQKRKADPRPATHEEHAPKPSAVRKSALTFRAGAKDREWLRKDVEKAAARSGHAKSTRPKPQTAAERRQRELEWIRRDVELHAPRAKLKKASARPATTPALQKEAAIQKETTPAQAPQPLLKGSPPRDPLELQRREKLWIEQEGDKLRAARASKAAAAREQTRELREVKAPGTQSSRSGSSPASRPRDEGAWIQKDLALHEPLRRQRCQHLQSQDAAAVQEAHGDFLRTACLSLFNINIDELPKDVPGSSTTSTSLPPASVRSSQPARSMPAHVSSESNVTEISAKVKQQLSGVIPEDVVDK
ncbi:unnamed protein product, partial [Symbiodinium pilosum]